MPTRPQNDPGQVLDAPMEGPPTPNRPRPTLQELADDLLENPAAWFAAPNPRFGGRRPQDLIGTDMERKVYAVLYAADQGQF